jgi:hypothetical protein
MLKGYSKMTRRVLLFTWALILASCCYAQNTSTSGTINAAATSNQCTARGCVYFQVPPNTAWVTIQVSGTWSGTLQVYSVTSPNASFQNLNSQTWSLQAQITGNGNWSVANGLSTFVLVQASSFSSGAAQINMTASPDGTPLNNPVFPGTITGTGLEANNGGSSSNCWLTNGSYANCSGGGGSGSGTVNSGTAGQEGIYAANGTTISGAQRACPFVTDPPYNAACDGSTDDSAAIQAAMNANGCIQLPVNTHPAIPGPTTCKFASPLVQNNTSLTIVGNGSIFEYAGTGAGYSFIDPTPFYGLTSLRLEKMQLADTTSGTGLSFINPAGIQYVSFNGVYDSNAHSGYSTFTASSYINYLLVQNSSMNSPSLTADFVFDNVDIIGNSSLSGTGAMSSALLSGGLTLGGGTNVSFSSTTIAGLLALGTAGTISGSATVNSISGGGRSGNFCYLIGTASTCLTYGLQTYSSASNQLSPCSSTVIGTSLGTAWVSDATSLTPGTPYSVSAGAGAITVQVQCTHSGSSYSWQTM